MQRAVGSAALAALLLLAAPAAANEFVNTNGTRSQGVVPEDGTGNVLGVSVPVAVAIAPGVGAGAAQVVGVGTGTTAAVPASLAAVALKTNYICGFTITAGATSAAAGSATVSGLIGSVTFTYNQAVGAATAPAKITENFNPCLPASAVNTAITVTSAAAGTGGVTDVNVWGYRQ